MQIKIEKIQEVNLLAAQRVSEHFSKLTKKSVHVEFSKVVEMKVEKITLPVPSEELVAGVHMAIAGQLDGAALLAFPMDVACVLADSFLRKSPGTTKTLTDMDKSSLKEIGNIVLGGIWQLFPIFYP